MAKNNIQLEARIRIARTDMARASKTIRNLHELLDLVPDYLEPQAQCLGQKIIDDLKSFIKIDRSKDDG